MCSRIPPARLQRDCGKIRTLAIETPSQSILWRRDPMETELMSRIASLEEQLQSIRGHL